MSHRILVIDDEPNWCTFFKDAFEAIGLEADTAQTVAQARGLLDRNEYALVALDLVLTVDYPDHVSLDCQTFLEHLRRYHPTLPIVAFTGKPLPPEEAFNLAQTGIVHLVSKKRIQLPELRQRIEQIIAVATSVRDQAVARRPRPLRAFIGHGGLHPEFQIFDQPSQSQAGKAPRPTTARPLADAPSPTHAGRDDTPGIVVILTALNLEYQAIRRHLTGLSPHHHRAGTLYEVGLLPGAVGRVAIAVTGDGNRTAAVLTERAASQFQPVALLWVGVAGALRDDIPLGDVVVATKTYSYHGGQDTDEGFLARPTAWPAPHGLEQLARHVARNTAWHDLLPADGRQHPPGVHFRPIAAGEVVANSRATVLSQQLHHIYNDAAAIEMESAGAAQAGHLNIDLPVLTIRGISDRADGTKYTHDAEGWQPIAAANAAAFAITLAVQVLSVNPADRGTSRHSDIEAPDP